MPAVGKESDKEAGHGVFPRYADVVVPRGLGRSFTYLIPSDMRSMLAVGLRVIVPLGASTVSGIVVSLHHRLPSTLQAQRLKEIQSLVTSPGSGLLPTQLQLSRWLSERYLAPWGQCIKCASPPTESPAKPQTKWFITPEGRRSLISPENLTIAERGMLERLARRASGLTWQALKQKEGRESADSTRTALMRRRFIQEREAAGTSRRLRTEGHHLSSIPSSPDHVERQKGQSSESLTAFGTHLRRLWESGQLETVLLRASFRDRMKALVQAVHETLHRKRRVLILTGEVNRARDIGRTLRESGIEPIHVYHASLPLKERAFTWQTMLSGQATVVVGTRSAGFSPIQDLGLVWVDGEEDTALKEEQAPRYHAREIARMRAQLDHAMLVMASAHPSLECVHAVEMGAATLWSMPTDGKPATVEIVDLRRFSAGILLSPPMVDGIRTALAERALVILYLNRTGYAPLLLCRACGQAPSCPGCSLALRFHKKMGWLVCHYCGHKIGVPDVCPACRAARLEPFGAGTERVEELLRQHFPQIRIARMDSETIRRRGQLEALLALAGVGDIDVIIGTQMLFLHRELPPAGLVGVLYPDAGLHLPDFRSAEHTYHALQDAVALSRTDGTGRVIIQTHLPHHHAIQAVAHDDPLVFNNAELAFRKALEYPPFTHLVRLDVSGTSERYVKSAAEGWAAALRRAMIYESRSSDSQCSFGLTEVRSVAVLGPAPAPVPRRRRRYRWQLLVKSDSQQEVLRVVKQTLPGMEGLSRVGGIKFSVDVDPLTML
jgi:primosomal protein N' (replication factor Y)